MPIKKLKTFLDKHKVDYECIQHECTYTAQETAECTHIPGKELAKTVILWLDQSMCMVIVPAPKRVDFDSLQKQTGASFVRLAIEEEFNSTFPNCEVGAFPPFGNLYKMKVYVDESLKEDDVIGFNAGTHTEIMKLKFSDYDKLVKPQYIQV